MDLYYTCYDLISYYIYGDNVPAGSFNELVCILVATAANLFLVALPFLLVWKILRMI